MFREYAQSVDIKVLVHLRKLRQFAHTPPYHTMQELPREVYAEILSRLPLDQVPWDRRSYGVLKDPIVVVRRYIRRTGYPCLSIYPASIKEGTAWQEEHTWLIKETEERLSQVKDLHVFDPRPMWRSKAMFGEAVHHDRLCPAIAQKVCKLNLPMRSL